MRRRSATLTAQELEIMKIVWQRESVTVRDVYEALLEHRKVAYTTVMTMMKILEQKKYLKKTQNDRAYVYRPAQPQRQVIGAMVRDFVNRVFNGSAEPLLVHLVEEHNLSRADLDEISRLREESRKAARGRDEEKPRGRSEEKS
jgi:BlaI family transcriptional regulator, penicillinase repressor